MKISKIFGEFLFKHTRNLLKRVFYNYYLRDLSLASIELPIGLSMLIFGILFGGFHWIGSIQLGREASAGTVMISAISILLGLQFILAFIGYDISSVPKRSLHKRFKKIQKVKRD